MPKQNQKVKVAGFVCFMICTVSITAIYLPFFSNIERVKFDGVSKRYGGSKGSMWKNMDNDIRRHRPRKEEEM